MMRTRLGNSVAATVLVALMTGAVPAQPSYEFTPFPGAVAIASNGVVLTADSICRNGACESVSH